MKKWSELSKAVVGKSAEIFNERLTYAQENSERIRLQQVEKELAKATMTWTLPLLMRTYGSGDDSALRRESQVFGEHGYEPSMQSEDGGHVHVGRLLLTGGMSVFAGKKGVRSGGKRTLTWRRGAAPTAAAPTDTVDQMRQLAALRDEGLITSAEFESKKTELLGRL